jgi:hypothetical protein
LHASASEVPLESQLHYDSAVFWLGQGDPEKACEFLRHAIAVHPNYTEARQLLPEAVKALKEKNHKELLEQEELKRRQQEAIAFQRVQAQIKAQAQQQQEYNKQAAAEEKQRQDTAIEKICVQCSKDCQVNKYEMDSSCYESCAALHNAYECLSMR